MGQQITFSTTGLNGLTIGQKIDSIAVMNFERLDKLSNKDQVLISPNDGFRYFYIKEKTLILKSNDSIKHLFFAIDADDIVCGVFAFLPSLGKDTYELMKETFGEVQLTSNSSIDGSFTNSKYFWKLNNITILLTSYSGRRSTKVSIVNSIGTKEPSVALFDN